MWNYVYGKKFLTQFCVQRFFPISFRFFVVALFRFGWTVDAATKSLFFRMHVWYKQIIRFEWTSNWIELKTGVFTKPRRIFFYIRERVRARWAKNEKHTFNCIKISVVGVAARRHSSKKFNRSTNAFFLFSFGHFLIHYSIAFSAIFFVRYFCYIQDMKTTASIKVFNEHLAFSTTKQWERARKKRKFAKNWNRKKVNREQNYCVSCAFFPQFY